MKNKTKLLLMISAFLLLYYLPVENSRFTNAVFEALALVKWYAREHVLLCLIPAFFIAGAISVFVSQASVMKYFGAKANKFLSYSVASVSGTILAVCSCTVLPLFRTGDKCAGDHPDCAYSWLATWLGQSCRRGAVQCGDRVINAFNFLKRRACPS